MMEQADVIALIEAYPLYRRYAEMVKMVEEPMSFAEWLAAQNN